MKYTRKEFIKTSALLGGGILFSGNYFSKKHYEDDNRFKLLREGFGVFNARGGSIGYYYDEDALVVIDAQFPETAKIFIDGLRTKTDRNIDLLFNTHHHGDHTSGNPYLKQFAKNIVANENCVKLQIKRNTKPGEEDKIVTADLTFTDAFNADIGKEKINAFHLYPAHTGGDSVIHFEEANIAHVGDLVFNKTYPYFNLDDEGSFRGWITYLEKLYAKFDNDTVFIFGHGPTNELQDVTGKKEDLILMRDYISSILDYTHNQIIAGKTEDEIAETKEISGVVSRTSYWPDALGKNLREAYKELKR